MRVKGDAGGCDVIAGFKTGTDMVALYGYSTTPKTTVAGGIPMLGLCDGTTITLLGIIPPRAWCCSYSAATAWAAARAAARRARP